MRLILALRAGDGIRTRECLLGKQVPYHLATPARMPRDYISPVFGKQFRPR